VKIKKTVAANADMRRIYLYYAKQNPYAAERIIVGVDEKFRLLSRHPLLGRERLELGSDVRGILSGSHVILYSVKADTLTILRVIDGRMDIETEFNG
jgi:toxin ParE1/3/4